MKKFKFYFLIYGLIFMVACSSDEDYESAEAFESLNSVAASGLCTDDCGELFSGNHLVPSSYHIYPDEDFDVSCVVNGRNLSLFVNPATVPNRFRVKDGNGNSVIDSGWIGYADYPGPWGMNLSSGATYLRFKKNTDNYTLIVETATPPNQTDSWSARLSCQ